MTRIGRTPLHDYPNRAAALEQSQNGLEILSKAAIQSAVTTGKLRPKAEPELLNRCLCVALNRGKHIELHQVGYVV